VIGFDDAGTLEPGKRADLLVLAENPLERIRALTDGGPPSAVVQGGALVSGAWPGQRNPASPGVAPSRSTTSTM
jgi:cytosine/adenosine deaminase-related metal-dependent hydrolase